MWTFGLIVLVLLIAVGMMAAPATVRMKPLQFFVPITRVDEQERVVEGVCFANEVVEGEGGIRLKRTAMQAATPDYMQWGAVREMHQPIAAGTALGVEWQDDGTAVLRAHIVDDSAWKKVSEGVYKGFSVGVAARVMRGKDVESCTWIENSLVDRPKDPGAVITAYRMDGIQDEYEVVIKRDFAASVPALKAQDMASDLSAAFWMLVDILCYDCETAEECGTSIDQFAAYAKDICADSLGDRDAMRSRFERMMAERGPDALTRLAGAEGEKTQLLERAAVAEGELARVQAALSQAETAKAAAEGRVEDLERQAAPGTGPVRFPQALDREFLAGAGEPPVSEEVKRLREEWDTLAASRPGTQPEQDAAIIRMQQIKMLLRAAGA